MDLVFLFARCQANEVAHNVALSALSYDSKVEWFEEPRDIILDCHLFDACNRGKVSRPHFYFDN